MIGKEFYEDVASIIQRVSNKTDSMKTNNLILLNKVSNEMNELILKAQDVIKICLTDRNIFLKEVESIQNDFVELSKKMEVRQALEKSQTICESPTDIINPSPRESKLLNIFGESEEEEDGEEQVAREAARKKTILSLNTGKKTQEEKTRGGGGGGVPLRVQETLGLEYLENFVPELPSRQAISNQKGFTIPETMNPNDDGFDDYDSNQAFARSISRSESLASKKQTSNESIVSAASSSRSDAAKTPKKGSTSTPRKPVGSTPSKQAAAIVNSNKKIDQFFKKRDSPKGSANKGPQIRSISADLVAARKMTATSQQEQTANRGGGMTTRSGHHLHGEPAEKGAAAKFKSVFDVGSGDTAEEEFEETFVDEMPVEPKQSPKEITNVDNIKKESSSYGYEDHATNNQKSKRTRNTKSVDSDEENKDEDHNDHEDFLANFDKVPKKKSDSPGYKHVEVVRNKDKRKKLGTSTCRECENYWASVPEERRPKRMDEACRHRAKYQAPGTPEHFWEVEFPTTQQCIERGYGGAVLQNDHDDSLASRRPRRKRPLNMITNRKMTTDDEGLDFDN